jgi:hypothetical protein
MFKVWKCWCSISSSDCDIFCIIIAETKAIAISLVLEKYPEIYAREWSIDEIIANKRKVIGKYE